MANVTKVKAIELILDWNLWPRHEAGKLDSTNITRMKQALRAGIQLPPITVDKKTNRVADGFHRVRSVLSVFGDDAEIDAIIKDFKNDAEILIESGKLNAAHGLPMSPLDRAHFAIKARKMKVPMPIIAEALGTDKDRLQKFLDTRIAKNKSGENIALPNGASSLAGKVLTNEQESLIKGINGMKAASNATILLNELKSGAFVIKDSFIKSLILLRDEITRILEEVGE